VSRGDDSTPVTPPPPLPEGVHPNVANLVNPQAGGVQGKPGGGGQSGSTSFSSKIDFTIIDGVNGGPSWTLLKWKIGGGAGGGGGGGGGGGAGGGAGAAAAGGGGGGGQMLNWNRTVVDSLVITLTPTCTSLVDVLSDLPEQKSPPAKTLAWSVGHTDYTIDTPKWPDEVGPVNKAGSSKIRIAKGAGVPAYGTIKWGGYAYPALVEGRESDALGRTELRGAVIDPISGNNVGVVTLIRDQELFADQARKIHGYVTTGLYQTLSDDEPTPDYWSSIQSCEQVTAAEKQTMVEHAFDLNTLFKLSNTQRQRLLQ
jgi:hypothetical protein